MNYLFALYFKVRRYFFNFDTIMKKFAKAEAKMVKFSGEMHSEAMKLEDMIEQLRVQRDNAIEQTERATRVAERIAEFLS